MAAQAARAPGQDRAGRLDDGEVVARIAALGWFKSEGPKLLYLALYHKRRGIELPALVEVDTTDLGKELHRPESTIRRWRDALVDRGLAVKVKVKCYRLHSPPAAADQVVPDHAGEEGRPLLTHDDRPALRVCNAPPTAPPMAPCMAPPVAPSDNAPIPARARSDTEAETDADAAEVKRPRAESALGKALLDASPILQEARGRKVTPLESGRTIGGAFCGVVEADLKRPLALVEQFRRQLDSPRCLGGDTEADLLLWLAAARWARKIPAKKVKESRLAAFKHAVGRSHYRGPLEHLPAARAALDELVGVHPDVLTGPWPQAPDPVGDAAPDQAAGDVAAADPDVAAYAAKLERQLAARRAVAERQERARPGQTSEGFSR